MSDSTSIPTPPVFLRVYYKLFPLAKRREGGNRQGEVGIDIDEKIRATMTPADIEVLEAYYTGPANSSERRYKLSSPDD